MNLQILEDFIRRELTVSLNLLKREESYGSERFVESSYQVMSEMVDRILEQLPSIPINKATTNPLISPQRPLSSSSSNSFDRYDELINENKRLSLKIREYAAHSQRENIQSDEELSQIKVIYLILYFVTHVFNE